MKLYIQQVNGVFVKSEYREDFENISKDVYNGQGWFDFEPTPTPLTDINIILTNETYLDEQNIARYRWTQTLKTGEDLVIATQDKWDSVRGQRNEILSKSDFTQLADAPITAEKKTEWATYRQSLRNITTQTDPFNITWPVSPDGRIVKIGVARV